MMEKKDIISMFLKNGDQLDASALEYFCKNPININPFIERLSTVKQPPIITLDFIKETLKKQFKLNVIKKFSIKDEKEKASILEYSNIFLNLYESLKNILVKKIDKTKLLSINKIQKETDFVIISMVREKDPIERTVLMEDLTGQISVSFKDGEFKTLYENDVVGVECRSFKNKVIAKKIIWPDIPFKKRIEKSVEDIYTIFISDIHFDSDSFDKKRYEKLMGLVQEAQKGHKQVYIFILGGISKRKEDIESFIKMLPAEAYKVFLKSDADAGTDESENLLISDSPIILKIDNITILLCQGDHIYEYKELFDGSSTDVMMNIMKRRNLRPFIMNKLNNIPLTPQIISPVPNIFASGSFHSAGSVNYKGMTLLTTGDISTAPEFWTINLQTREINKVDIA